ncbi:unnamed protein product [Closterium sp. Naga37s-1]|nr:unnamed protein product [Closterium sp. Naga37s-1]
MTFRSDWMENVRESSEDYILQGNSGKLPVTGEGDVVLQSPYGEVKLESVLLVEDLKWEKYADGYFSDGFYEMNLVAMNDMDEIYEDHEYGEMGEFEELSVEDDESEDSDDTAASVEAAVKLKEEIVAMEAAAVNGGDGVGVNTFAAAIVVEDEAVNAKYMGVEAVKGDILVKGSKVKATAKGRVLTKEEHVEGYETREVLGFKMQRRSDRQKKISQGLDVKALNFKTRKQRFEVQELQGSVKAT